MSIQRFLIGQFNVRPKVRLLMVFILREFRSGRTLYVLTNEIQSPKLPTCEKNQVGKMHFLSNDHKIRKVLRSNEHNFRINIQWNELKIRITFNSNEQNIRMIFWQKYRMMTIIITPNERKKRKAFRATRRNIRLIPRVNDQSIEFFSMLSLFTQSTIRPQVTLPKWTKPRKNVT